MDGRLCTAAFSGDSGMRWRGHMAAAGGLAVSLIAVFNLAFAAVLDKKGTFLDRNAAGEKENRIVVLRGLDKVTARISDLEIPVGERLRFGSLLIKAVHCYKRPPEEFPETSAFLEIDEARPDETARPLFRGWMLASSPGLSSLEHPVYDVWVIDCKTVAPDTSSGQ